MLRSWGILRPSQSRDLIPPEGITPRQLCDDTHIRAADRVQILLSPEILSADACVRIARLASDRARGYAVRANANADAAEADDAYAAYASANANVDAYITAAARAANADDSAAYAAAAAAYSTAYAASYGSGSTERELQLANIRAELLRLETHRQPPQ
jgi:hypothetical protein